MKLYQGSGAETVQTEVFGIVACAVSFFWDVSAFAGEILCNKNRYLKYERFLKISNAFLYVHNISRLHISNRVCELRLKEFKRQFWLTHCFIFNHLGYSVDQGEINLVEMSLSLFFLLCTRQLVLF